ncbi:hypothetical protein AEQ67_21865 [Pseudomonas sp. RIT-PI-q]|nr:hypothetical protein AEQ67_21865 [Pseudomonas sp. RIT-PI-q]
MAYQHHSAMSGENDWGMTPANGESSPPFSGGQFEDTRTPAPGWSVHCNSPAYDLACVHAATQHFIKQPAKQITVPETGLSIVGKIKVIGYFNFKAQPEEPASNTNLKLLVIWLSPHQEKSPHKRVVLPAPYFNFFDGELATESGWPAGGDL